MISWVNNCFRSLCPRPVTFCTEEIAKDPTQKVIGRISSIEAEKLPLRQAIEWRSSEKTSEELCRWTVENHIISLVRDILAHPQKLRCIVEDVVYQNNWQLDLGDRNVEEIMRCKPIVEEDGSVTFAKPIHVWPLNANTDVCLLKRTVRTHAKWGIAILKYNLIWYLYNKKNNKAQVDPIDFPATIFRENRIFYALAHKVVIQPSRYIMEPVSKQSLFDPTMIVEGHQWVVSLADAGRSRWDPCSWFGHAAIFVEGIKPTDRGGHYFMSKAHLYKNKSGKPEVRWVDETSVSPEDMVASCRKKFRSWQRSAIQVINLIQRVKWEIEMQKKGQPQVFFHLQGSHAIGVSPQKSAEFPSYQEWEQANEKIPGKRMEASFSNYYFFPKSKRSLPDTTDHLAWKRFHQENPPCRTVRKNQETDMFEEFIMPDNCTTWAIKRLYLAEIDLPPGQYPALATFPGDYKNPIREVFKETQSIFGPTSEYDETTIPDQGPGVWFPPEQETPFIHTVEHA